jgi:hypothetical protein
MNGLDLSTRLAPWAMAFLITLALATPLTAMIGLARTL